MVMTYNSLVDDVETYLIRTDTETIDKIPNFIFLAESRLCKDINSIGIESYAVSAFTPNVSVYPKPGTWRRSLNLNYGSGTGFNTINQIQLVKYEFASMYWPNRTIASVDTPPLYYSEYGMYNFLVVPTPALAYPFEFSYMELPQLLSASNQTNWFTNYAPDVLFFATMIEAVAFAKDFELMDVWGKRYQEALSAINTQDVQRKSDRLDDKDAD